MARAAPRARSKGPVQRNLGPKRAVNFSFTRARLHRPRNDASLTRSRAHERKAEGTELPAIVSFLREHVEQEEKRIRIEQRQTYQQWRERQQTAREERLLSGADCKWMQMRKSPHWYCRSNGRTYRLSPTEDKMWNLHRVSSISDDEQGATVGKYRRRGDATKAVAEMAYRPEPRW